MGQLKQAIQSGARLASGLNPVERIVIGLPGTPTQLLVYKGKIYVYNSSGQALIDGGYIGANQFQAGTVIAEKLSAGAKKFIHNLIWTATDYNTCSWGSGIIKFVDGSSANINSGNTGNITEKTYIYYNGTTTLQKTTSYSSAIGGNNIPLAIVEPDTDTSGKCIITSFINIGTTIDGDLVTTGKIQSTDGKTYFDLNNNVFIIDDGVTKRLRLGKIGTEYGIKLTIPGRDVDDETDLDYFALWAVSDDEDDNVLIKELKRDSKSVGAGGTENIAHNLGYIPFCLVFVEETSGVYTKAYGEPFDSRGFYYLVDTTNLVLKNTTGSSKTFKYYIFYDQIT